ncbi:hypothetical protein HDZ31DRAFT_80582 [Schizophyllum fasciatum]
MAESPSKRPLTDTCYTTSAASNVPPPTGASEDLAAALRNIGSRVRRNVTEGYISAPSPHASPTKGNIFRSANDALQEALHSPSKAGSVSPRKRNRARANSVSDDDEEGNFCRAKDGEDTVMADPFADTTGEPLPPNSIFNREVKPLRKSRLPAHYSAESKPSHNDLASNVALSVMRAQTAPMEN